jgi:hypothetical protein
MTEAIFGLVGVVVGGLLTAGLEELRRRADSRDRRRAAARAVHTELLATAVALDSAIEMKSITPLTLGRRIELGAVWHENAAALSHLALDEWDELARSVWITEMFWRTSVEYLTEWTDKADATLTKLRDDHVTPGINTLAGHLD